LADDHPADADLRQGLAKSHDYLGLLLVQIGKPRDAEPEFRQALATYRELIIGDPHVPGHRIVAANADSHLSVVFRRLGRASEALDHAERAVAVLESLVEENPERTDYHENLADLYLTRGLARHALAFTVDAAADARRALGIRCERPHRAGWECFATACYHAAMAGLTDRADEAEAEAENALGLLRRAVDLGYRSPALRHHEDSLDPLRSREDFRLLLMDLAFPADVFAPP
jgi:tetratricopeptide (TPR) repeat protein